MSKTKSSKCWFQEHRKDIYVKRAKAEDHRARSFYKLKELQEKYRIIKHGMKIVDLGAAPGSWSKYARHEVGTKGSVFAIDILPVRPILGVEFIQGDFTDPKISTELIEKLEAKNTVDLILSDMAPNLSGLSIVDQANALKLAETVLAFAEEMLKPKGSLLLKIFQGEDYADFLKKLRSRFVNVKTIKPAASRSRSKEIFLLANRLKYH